MGLLEDYQGTRIQRQNAMGDLLAGLGYADPIRMGQSLADSGMESQFMDRDTKLRMAAAEQAAKLHAADMGYAGEQARADALGYQSDNALRGVGLEADAKRDVANTAGGWNLQGEQAKAQALVKVAMLKALMAAKMSQGEQMTLASPDAYLKALLPLGMQTLVSRFLENENKTTKDPALATSNAMRKVWALASEAQRTNPWMVQKENRNTQMPMMMDYGGGF